MNHKIKVRNGDWDNTDQPSSEQEMTDACVWPEVRRWGPPAGMFMTAPMAVDLLTSVSQIEPEIAMGYTEEVDYGVYRVHWDDGTAILDRFATMGEQRMSFVIDEVEKLLGLPINPKKNAFAFLHNLRACAKAWREYIDPDDGSLELLLDA